jgi:xanthine dehydrogenase YagS FAD-binding subunit
MHPFAYSRADTIARVAALDAPTRQGQVDAAAQYLAGGTTLVDLMKLDVLRPAKLVDLTPLKSQHAAVEVRGGNLHLGAFATMAAAAEHKAVLAGWPAIADSLKLAASAQIRNMATLGGNVLQRTRCSYFRDTSWKACNKRAPGSGCAAIGGVNRNHAVLGVDDSCISQSPSDFAVALAAFGASVLLDGPDGTRTLPFATLHRPPAGQPHLETNLKDGEVITGFVVPGGPAMRRSLYLKIRDRESYEFAIAAAAVGLDMDGEVVRTARIGLGGMAYRPWRSAEAEAALTGKRLDEATAEAAAAAALAGAQTREHNSYKPTLARQTLVRALLAAKAMRS